MHSYFELLSDHNTIVDDIIQPRSTFVQVTMRPRSQTLPGNFAPSEFLFKPSVASIAPEPVDGDKVILDSNADEILGIVRILHAVLDLSGLRSLRQFLNCLFRVEKRDLRDLDLINSNENSSKIGTQAVGEGIDNECRFSRFQWLPTEVKVSDILLRIMGLVCHSIIMARRLIYKLAPDYCVRLRSS